MNEESVIALRMDDVGASSKRYEVYSKTHWRLGRFNVFSGDWLFFKYIPPFRAWGPYRELSPREWFSIFGLLEQRQWKLTVGVTAAWASGESDLIPFPVKFPAEASALKEGLQAGLLEIANHGLTHSVLANNAFKPKWFTGNRRYHREFYDWISPEVHEEHIQRSQQILQDYFSVPIVTLVPPGNVFAEYTLDIAARYGIQYVSCNTPPRPDGTPQVLGNRDTLAFHDRELVLEGLGYFDSITPAISNKRSVFVKDLAATLAGEPA
ncbi:MAG: polysaccharide deacetylase family protein [Anaerolineales bacterium]|nr:polysaccharide deacetylase family protein [Anaerolineales bacterium]